jgi:hypothetical protein
MTLLAAIVLIQVAVSVFAALREKKQAAFEGDKLGYRS